jgi:glycerol-3-phosphate acyltransferase PlsY
VDLRAEGSRNIGATNAYRVLGARWGLLVFALDAAKGSLAAIAPAVLARPNLAASLAGGVAAILGHVFSPWVGFKGGRGVATSLGVFLAIVPIPTLLAFGIWVLLMILTRRVSVGSIGASLAYPFLVFSFAHDPDHRILLTAITALVSLLVIVRHRANIRRLLQGTEPPLRRGGAR